MISPWFPVIAFLAVMYGCWTIGKAIEAADKRAREQRAEIVRQLDRIASKMDSHYNLLGSINAGVRGAPDEPSWWDTNIAGGEPEEHPPE